MSDTISPVIIAGGVGSRLWPLSREFYPKQLLSLLGKHSLLQDTILRVSDTERFGPATLVCNEQHRFLVAEQLRKCEQLQRARIILESVGRNTAPAVALAALQLLQDGEDNLMLVLPADHIIRDGAQFAASVINAADVASQDYLVTFGVTPDAPETGYGYIKQGEAIAGSDLFKVAAFVEKPDLRTAEEYIKTNQYSWNSGMFLFKASTYLAELERYNPAMFNACKKAMSLQTQDMDFIRPDADTLKACASDSIDYAVMEKTGRAAVQPISVGWSDIGSWAALHETEEQDEHGNVVIGDVLQESVVGSYIRAEDRLIAAIGVKNQIIVETKDAVLVAHKDYSQQVKNIVEHLNTKQREEAQSHTRVYRPWGYYETIDEGEAFKVKRIVVNPGSKLSLQSHQHRSEHWVIVYGTAEVVRGDEVLMLRPNQSTYIPAQTKHRMINQTDERLEFIEVQVGSYLGEDDIVRFEDQYMRV